VFRCLEYVIVAYAAAIVPSQRLLDLIHAGAWIFIQQRAKRDDDSRRAITALERVIVYECLLYDIKGLSFGIFQPFYRDNVRSVALACQNDAGRYGIAIHDYGATPARALLTRFLRASKPQPVTQGRKKRFVIWYLTERIPYRKLVRFFIDRDFDNFAAHSLITPSLICKAGCEKFILTLPTFQILAKKQQQCPRSLLALNLLAVYEYKRAFM
jgi:hypothetical protein